jgi:general secretion pathway protein N
MRAYRKYIAVLAGTFVLFLLLFFPARAGFWLFAPEGVNGFGFSGTVWNGSSEIIQAGNLRLRDTQWDLNLLRLLLGQIAGDIETRWNGGFLEGSVAVAISGDIAVRDARGNFDASTLQAAFNTPPMGGQISVDITSLELSDRWPEYLVATAEVRNLSSPMLGAGADSMLGSFAIRFDTTTETEVGSVTGKIEDSGGPLEANGTLLLTAPGQYSLKVRVKPRDGVSLALRRNLDFLGPPEADGARIFQLAGSM